MSLHGDYRYDSLKNTEEELQQQEVQLRQALIGMMKDTSLIVIGYSGRDQSIMEALAAAYSQNGAAFQTRHRVTGDAFLPVRGCRHCAIPLNATDRVSLLLHLQCAQARVRLL